MQFSVALNDFQRHLQKVMPAAPTKSTMPALEHFLISASDNVITIKATDIELAIIATMPANVEVSGAALVPARKLSDIIKALADAEGSVTFTCGANYDITLKTGFGKYSMKGFAENNFPELPDLQGNAEAFLPAADIMRMANKTVFNVSTDEHRPAMTGVLIQFRADHAKAVGTDGFRLSRVIIKVAEGKILPDEFDFIIPARMAELLRKIDSDVKVTVSRTHAQFSMNDYSIITRLIDERYPAYENVIPAENDKIMTVNNRELLAAIRRVSLFASSSSRQIRFAISPNLVVVRGEDDESGNSANEEVKCEFNGDELEIGFNYKYVEEALQNMDVSDANGETTLLFSSPGRAVLLQNNIADPSLLMLIMPVRI